jgi:hypothetical protein
MAEYRAETYGSPDFPRKLHTDAAAFAGGVSILDTLGERCCAYATKGTSSC